MEQALLTVVVTKIGEALASEALKTASTKEDEVELVTQIQSSMELIKSEFEVMQAFLKEIDKQKDEVTEAWLNRVREVASQMGKIVDEFVKICGRPSKKLPNALLETFGCNSWDPFIAHIKEQRSMSAKTSAKSSVGNQIGAQLRQIEADLDHILKMKVRWEITAKCSKMNGS